MIQFKIYKNDLTYDFTDIYDYVPFFMNEDTAKNIVNLCEELNNDCFDVEKCRSRIANFIGDITRYDLYTTSAKDFSLRYIREISIIVLLELLYNLNYINKKYAYIPINDIAYIQNPSYSSKTIKGTNYKIEIKKYLSLEQDKKNTYVNAITEQVPTFFKNNTELLLKYQKNTYINAFQLHYVRFIMCNIGTLDEYYDECLNSFTIADIQGHYSDNMKKFIKAYKAIIHSAKDYLTTFEVKERSADYYLFMYQLYKDTSFLDIFYLSNIVKHDYKEARISLAFDRLISFKKQYFKEKMKIKDVPENVKTEKVIKKIKDKKGNVIKEEEDEENVRILHEAISYDDSFDYYRNYIFQIYNKFLGPTLSSTVHQSYESLYSINNSLTNLRSSIDMCVYYILYSSKDKVRLEERVLTTLNKFVTDNTLARLNKIIDSSIIGNDFQNICFHLLQDIYKEKNNHK